MSNSSLIDYVKISPNKTSPRNHKIDKITIHHMAGNLSVESCGNVFAPSSRKASSNYGIDSNGRVGLYVEEKDRSWCSSNGANDHRAVTIEVADDIIGSPWHSSDKAMNKLIELCVDICKRNGIPRLNYTGNTSGNLTMHKWFAATDCPGSFLESKFPYIAEQVNKRLSGQNTVNTTPVQTVTTYTIQKGDSLSSIASKYGTTYQKLAELNGIANPSKIYPGQIIKLQGNASQSSSQPQSKPSSTTKVNTIVRDGQIHARNFAAAGLQVDGIRGSKTKEAGIKVLQQAMNLDYRSVLTVDGIWGSNSERALSGHTVRKGETQYMVTALEILLMLKGYNPNGVENPGHFGSGLEAAVRAYQKDHGLTADGIAGYYTFKSLIG